MTAERVETIFRLTIAAAFGIVGLLIFGLQVLGFLNAGEWVPLSILDIASAFLDWPWLLSPQSWIGVHKILSFIPASLAFLAVSWFFIIYDDAANP